jgi:hypothetical protein
METTHDYTTIYCQSCGHSHAIPVRCGRRFCAICSKQSATRTRRRLEWICDKMVKPNKHSWKFVTLTLVSRDDLSAMVDDLIRGFRKLRGRKLWSDAVTGGVYVLEVTHTTQGWHAHLHIIAMMRYVPQRWLSATWKSITGSMIVDIRQIKGRSPIGYVTHYLTTFDLPPAIVQDAEDAVRNRRLWSPFGTAHDLNLTYVPPTYPCPHCGEVAWISQRGIDRCFAHAMPYP